MIKLRKFKKGDTRASALLVAQTYKQFNSQEFVIKSAAQKWIDYYDPQKNTLPRLYKKFQKTPIFYVALENNKIIGIIRGRPNQIVNLFVNGKYHKKGIGRILVNKFEAEAKKQKPQEIKINSSLYAAPFYQKMGYKKTTGIRNFRGLKVFPMKKKFIV